MLGSKWNCYTLRTPRINEAKLLFRWFSCWRECEIMLTLRVRTKEDAIATANYLMDNYPQLKTVEDVIEQARKDNVFGDEIALLITWGRLSRLLPFRA